MAKAKLTATKQFTVNDSLESMLAKLPAAAREKELKSALRAAARKAINRAKALVPQPGYKYDKPERKPLKDTIAVSIKSYGSGQRVFAAVGPSYPAGAHGHLVEHGHEIVLPRTKQATGKRTREKKFMAPAVDQTMDQQLKAMDDKLLKAIKKHDG